MSGVAAQALSHVIRRGLEQAPATTNGHAVMQFSDDAEIEISTSTMVILGAIGILTLLIIASVDYTVGSVMATLAMIESPSTTTIVESAPPAYTDEPDAPLEKKIDAEDIEVVVINHKPITASVVGTIKHLHRVGGFFGRWRGLFQSILYHMLVNISGHAFGGFFRIFAGPVVGQGLGYLVSVVALCRLRMLWTHAMISMPTKTRWYRRFVSIKQCKPLLLPSMVYAVSSQACIAVPVLAFWLTKLTLFGQYDPTDLTDAWTIIRLVTCVLVVPVSALMVALFLVIPAATSLTRVEACLLPEDQETIVPFDRQAIVGDIDLTQRCSSKKLFSAAWKSSSSARLRLVKLYVKLSAFQFAVLFVGLQLMGTIAYFVHKEQIHTLIEKLQQ